MPDPPHRRPAAIPIGTLVALGVLAVSSATASAGLAVSITLPGATPDSASYTSVIGCSTLSHAIASLNPHSGLGKFGIATQVANCPRSLGINSSSAWSLSILGVLIPVGLRSSSHGVSLGFSLQASATEIANVTGSSARCPITTQTSNVWNGTTWFNQTYSSAECHLLANVYLTAYAYLEDTTTGAHLFPTSAGTTSWSNESGYDASYVAYRWNYSNPAYWGGNYSSPGSWTNYSYGPGGPITISGTPTFYFNGSFLGSHKYVLGFFFQNEVFSEQAHFKGHAKAIVNAATSGNHEDVTAMTVY